MNGVATVVDQSPPLLKCADALHRMVALAENALAAERRYHDVLKTIGGSRAASRALAKAAESLSQAQTFAAQVAEANALLARIAESNGPILIPGSRAVSKAEDGRGDSQSLEEQFSSMDPAARAALLAKLANGGRQ